MAEGPMPVACGIAFAGPTRVAVLALYAFLSVLVTATPCSAVQVSMSRWNGAPEYNSARAHLHSAAPNLYAYCGGDPVNRHDPSGLRWLVRKENYEEFKKDAATWFQGAFTTPLFPEDVPQYEAGGPGSVSLEQTSIFTKGSPVGGENSDLIEININKDVVPLIGQSINGGTLNEVQAFRLDTLLSNVPYVYGESSPGLVGLNPISDADDGNVLTRSFSERGAATHAIATAADFAGPALEVIGKIGEFEMMATGGTPGSAIGGALREAGFLAQWARAVRATSSGSGRASTLSAAFRPAVTQKIYPAARQNPIGSALLGDNLAMPGSADVMVIGRLPDTRAFIGKPGFNVLNTTEWSPALNDAWLARGIREGRTFQLATPLTMDALRSGRVLADGTWERAFTVYYRELKMLRNAGYVREGNLMVPAPVLVP